MTNKTQLLAVLTDEFDRWEKLLASRTEAQITARPTPLGMSIHDVIGHLRAWQQVSVARLEAALHQREPEMPSWLAKDDPEAEEQTDDYNARIDAIYRDQPWASVQEQWRAGFRRVLELSAAIPASDLLAAGKYPWLNGYALSAVLEGTYGHHQEHWEELAVVS